MESNKLSTDLAQEKSPKIIDAKAMVALLDEMNGGPAKRAMDAIGDDQGDIPINNQPHDFEEK